MSAGPRVFEVRTNRNLEGATTVTSRTPKTEPSPRKPLARKDLLGTTTTTSKTPDSESDGNQKVDPPPTDPSNPTGVGGEPASE